MPKHKVHKLVDRLLLGKAHPKVHKTIDAPYKLLKRKHRAVFHTPIEGFAIGAITEQSIEGGISGVLHVVVDKQTTKHKKLRKTLELLANLDSQKQTRKPTKTPKKRKKRSNTTQHSPQKT